MWGNTKNKKWFDAGGDDDGAEAVVEGEMAQNGHSREDDKFRVKDPSEWKKQLEKQKEKIEAEEELHRRTKEIPPKQVTPAPVKNAFTIQVEALKKALKSKDGWKEKLSDPMIRLVFFC